MLETCLNNKIIRDFLNNYKQSRWKKLIPSLIEIAILNLNSSFHTDIFSEEDIKNIIDDLKINQNQEDTQQKKLKKENHSYVIFSKPSNQWRTADGGVPPISGSKDKEFFCDNSSLTNYSKYNKDNKEIARENIINKKQIKNAKSKIKEQVDNDKKNYYNKKNGDNDFYKKNKNKPIEKINYAISYDKNLEPELIEKTTINKNRKGRQKIVEKMTQEEYEQKFPDEEQNIENEYEEEDDDNNNEQNYEENEEEEYYEAQNSEQNYNNKNYNVQNNNVQNNYQNIDRKNLYHYKTDINNKNNSIINNTNQGSKNNDDNPEMMQNPQQSFNQKNNYINIVNNSNEPQYMKYDYNPNPSEQYNNNYKVGMSESDDKSSKYIGIEQKYQKKIDELEKNIINTGGGNNIDNYANKLKVNITNMEEYSKNNNNHEEYQNNNDEEENENEENNLSDMDLNDMDGGVLSQMSNMSERTKDLFKRTMDEYPPLEEDTLYEQSQNK